MFSKALYLAFVCAAVSAASSLPAFSQSAFGGTNSMRNGLPATTVDSFVYEARENRDAIYGDEGTYMPPFENFTADHRIQNGIYARSDAGLTTGHGSYLPRAWGGDEFIGPEFSQSGSQGGDPNAILANVPLVNPPDLPVPPPMTFAPQAPELPPEGYGQPVSPYANIDLSGFSFGLAGIGPGSIKAPTGVPRNLVQETTGVDAMGRPTKLQKFSDGSQMESVQQSNGQYQPTKITYADGSSTVYGYDANNPLIAQQGMPNSITELNAQGQVVSKYTTTNYASWNKQAGTGPQSTTGTLTVTKEGNAFYNDPLAGVYLRGPDGSVLPV